MTTNEAMKNYTGTYVGPIMAEYTKWIISQCQKRNFKKIYFLARDGFLLCEIAKEICKQNNLQIECRYLYTSRFSLRLSSLHLIGDEAYKMCFFKTYNTSVQSMLKNAALTDEQIEEVCKEISVLHPEKNLSDKEYDEVVEKLKNNEEFNEILMQNSENAYKSTIQYFRQEKIFDDDQFVIADSGWAGSMQRSFRHLLENAGFNGKIVGFYFGLFNKTAQEDGEYLPFYFSHKKGLKRKIMFCNNLFECMLSANHGTTIGYENVSGKIMPILKEMGHEQTKRLIELQIEGVLAYVRQRSADLDICAYDKKASVKKCYKKIKKVMVYPSKQQIELLSEFKFSDSTTESYSSSLCDVALKSQLKKQLLICLVFKKLFRLKSKDEKILYWTYGVIRRCSKIAQPFYRLDFFIHEFLRFCLTK